MAGNGGRSSPSAIRRPGAVTASRAEAGRREDLPPATFAVLDEQELLLAKTADRSVLGVNVGQAEPVHHTARRYKTIQIQAGNHAITAADPMPADLCDALHRVHHHPGGH